MTAMQTPDHDNSPVPIRPGVTVTPPPPRVRLLSAGIACDITGERAERLWRAVIEDMAKRQYGGKK